MDRRADKVVPTTFLVKLMSLVLTMNTFERDNKLFKLLGQGQHQQLVGYSWGSWRKLCYAELDTGH